MPDALYLVPETSPAWRVETRVAGEGTAGAPVGYAGVRLLVPVDRAGDFGVRHPDAVIVDAGVSEVDLVAGTLPRVFLIGEEGVVGVRRAVWKGHDVSLGLVLLVGGAAPHDLGDHRAVLVGVAELEQEVYAVLVLAAPVPL